MIHRFLLGALILVCLKVDVRADDWPQYRGPLRDGVSREEGLLKAWPKEGPPLKWTFKNAGLGFSDVAVVGKVVYLAGTRKDDEVIIALDLEKGTELWTAPIGPIFTFKNNTWGDGPRGTPTVAGDLIYCLGGQGDLVCVDLKGKEKWRKNMIKDLGGEMMTEWGYSESPLVDGDLVLCTPGGKDGTFAALDRKTGAVKWRSKELKNSAPYSSLVVATINGVRQYIGNSYDAEVGGFISGIDAAKGTVLWSMPIFEGASYNLSPTPIVKDNLVYITSSTGSGGGCHLFEIDKDMKATDKYPAKVQRKVKNNHGGVILVGDHVYGHTNNETWFCQDFQKGKVDWDFQPRDDDNPLKCPSGSITAADGKLYFYTDKGVAILVDVNPEKFVEISRFTIPNLSAFPKELPRSKASKVWSHPVIAHGCLFLRDCEFVYCYDIRAK
jgi:outer membrane protein assembly factor BamB